MKKEIRTEIVIQAPAEKIWKILTDFDSYPNWNPFIKSITGQVVQNSIFKVVIEAPDSKPMTFKPKVLVFEEEKEFRWLGHFLFRGLFDGDHKFELIDHKNGTTTFVQSEQFSGVLVPFLRKMLDTKTVKGFDLMNKKIKELAEKD